MASKWKDMFILEKKPIQKKGHSVGDEICRIAMHFGFLRRKDNVGPGVKPLWLDMQRLRDFVKGMAHMQNIYTVKLVVCKGMRHKHGKKLIQNAKP